LQKINQCPFRVLTLGHHLLKLEHNQHKESKKENGQLKALPPTMG